MKILECIYDIGLVFIMKAFQNMALSYQKVMALLNYIVRLHKMMAIFVAQRTLELVIGSSAFHT